MDDDTVFAITHFVTQDFGDFMPCIQVESFIWRTPKSVIMMSGSRYDSFADARKESKQMALDEYERITGKKISFPDNNPGWA